MAVPTGYDIGLDSTDPADANAVRGFMLVDHRQQDITPSSARRSDGDTRFQLIPSESFWSQQDWAGGYGRLFPHDPTMVWQGPADTREGSVIRSALAGTFNWATPAAGADVLAACDTEDGLIYVAVNDAGTAKLYSYAALSAAWTFMVNLGSTAVTAICGFRGGIWVAYGTIADVQRVDVFTYALTTPAPNFKAFRFAPYSSMLFYAHRDATTMTWRLNRYDPENTAAVADLAVLPVGYEVSDFVRALVPLGPDLFVVCVSRLYKFTSQNGNSGVLAGPVDSWLPAGYAGVNVSGFAACAYQGALVYSTGAAIRRHQPGGGARQIWPVPPNVGDPALSDGEAILGYGWQVCALLPLDDRLYCLASESGVGADVSEGPSIALLCWTGAGMHHLATETMTHAGNATTLRRVLGASDRKGTVVGLFMDTATPTVGKQLVYFGVAGEAAQYRKATTALRTSQLDFGQFDLEKVLSRVGVLCSLPNTSTYGVAVSVYLLDETASPPVWVSHPLATRTGNLSTAKASPSLVYFSRSASPFWLIARRCYLELTLTAPAGATDSAEVWALTAIPNPVYPVRYGFRATIPVGTHVRLHSGGMAYADQAAVDAALAYCRTLRASSDPFTLDWIDGASYTVRCNTISIVRDKLRPDESAWVVTLDLQEISG